ncbi:FAD-dependent oxidoreductase [Candidimonas humi]|jgi:fumarate reductase flavoprotein subunit|uniref:FAD-binding protein n=1 Tax=Candidimonas humi TaxID=683355 RepID=A0ABV8P085_9BURK|nr:FAD-binding protein [Candidimonas humi]MBV6304036.1 FAD-dependent oxidoreductase [Candidimonas humi]
MLHDRDVEFDAAVDILVIGAGGCGLCAALSAHSAAQGGDIAVLEKNDRLQGNTALSSGSIPAAGTRFQAQAGLADSAEAFVEDLQRIAGVHQMPGLTRRLAEVSAELVEWLVDVAGVNLTLVETYKHIGHRQYRLHSPPSRRGADLLDDLADAVARRNIPIVFGNGATDLVVDERGRVCGVQARTRDGACTTLAARAVILATNGFGNNRELLREFCPEVAAAPYGGATGSEGEAVLWGRELGADLANMGAYQAHASLADPHGSLVTWTVVEKGGFIVDASGRRFGDESQGYSSFAALELERAGPFHVIADARIRDLTAQGQSEYAELVANKGVLEFDTIQALGDRCGIEPVQLARTLGHAVAAAAGEEADSWGRSQWGGGPLRPPYTAMRISAALFHTQGGLRVDPEGRVLRKDGSIIPGLYAGGGAAAGISGARGSQGYMSGNGLLSALGLGYLAGRCAAGQLSREACS